MYFINLEGQDELDVQYTIWKHVQITCKRVINKEKVRLKKRMEEPDCQKKNFTHLIGTQLCGTC